MSGTKMTKPKVHLIPVSSRINDAMTVDDLLRAQAIAQVLNEPSFVAKLDQELASILATHNAVASVMDVSHTSVH